MEKLDPLNPLTLPAHCWSKIGVAGDHSCPRLDWLHHCRNCSVYSEAARVRLDEETPEGYLDDWTVALGAPEESIEAHPRSVLVFRVGHEWLALPAACFQEVAHKAKSHSLPNQSNLVQGLVNIRGALIMWISLESLLGLEPTGPSQALTELPRVLVVEAEGGPFAFMVQEILGVRSLSSRVQPELSSTLAGDPNRLTQEIFEMEGRSVGLMDPELLTEALQRQIR